MSFPCCAFSRFRKPGLIVASAAIVAVFGAIFFQTSQTPADLTGPRASDRSVSLVVTELLNYEHLLKRSLDDEISKRAMKSFLRNLDPMKVYFYQSDIDEFLKSETKLDDQIKRGDLDFAFNVFDRFLARVDERVGFVEELLQKDLDFTKDEKIATDRDATVYAKDRDAAFDRWRKRIKYDRLVLKSEEVTGDDADDRLKRRYSSYAKRMHQFKTDDLLEMYLTSITASFDPHTTYMSPSTLDDFHISMRLKLEGIGAALMMNDGYTVVSKVIPGGAADKNGKLQPEDRIVSVGQNSEGEMVDVIDMNLRDVVKLIRGRSGTVVRLGVKPASKNDIEIYKITRAQVELKESEARGEIIEDPKIGTHPDGSPVKIGVIDLPSFYMDMAAARQGLPNFKSTTRDVERILSDFRSKNVESVVLDLRRNGGGSLTEAINLTGLFIEHGPVVQVKDSANRVQKYDDNDRGMAWSGPLVVLTSKFSASASEILAGAIQDYNRGIIVGDYATHGKGTVQSLLDVGEQLFKVRNAKNLGALKITMQQFYRPDGDSTQKRGVLADVALPSLTTHMDVGESDLDFPVEFDKVDAARIIKMQLRNKNLVDELIVRSKTRRGANDEFKKLERNITRYREQKEKKFVTLNEKKFFEERKELDADKEEEKNIKEQLSQDRPVFKRDFYNDEVLSITADYVTLLKRANIAKAR